MRMRLTICLTEPGKVHWVFLDLYGGRESNVPNLFFLFLKLFDCQIQPVLTYGSEFWGIMADYRITERVHLFADKRFLNVSTRAPSALVYGETGRYPFYVNTYTRCIKYWLNLVRMPDNRLPSKSYKMLYDLHCKNKNNWVSYVCFTLYRYGFGFVWENQGVCNTKRYLCEFR